MKFLSFFRENFQIIRLVEVVIDCDVIREVGDILVTQTAHAVFLVCVFWSLPVVVVIIILQTHIMAGQMLLYRPPIPVDLLLTDRTLKHWGGQVDIRENLLII